MKKFALDEARTIVELVPDENGDEAWSNLKSNFTPPLVQRQGPTLADLAGTVAVKPNSLTQASMSMTGLDRRKKAT